ncbi:MAG: hypothetical protein BWY45_02203 [Euryarchaeota archaeon ADurb.Bin294]|jgi:hypothetical protein|nr:MAG: hypothetical protein BWY45_02203 [Euryarchaeota archaeon ADurb.Bin294]
MKCEIREVGSFFEFPSFDCVNPKESVFYYLTHSAGRNNYLFVQDGRQAIKAVLRQIKNVREKNCYLPAYLCHSIIQPFREMGLNIDFYNHEHPLIQNIDENIRDSVILIIDYFGTEFFRTEKIIKFLEQGNSVIIDTTHSILNERRRKLCHEDLYYIASLRKTFPIPDGAVIFHSHNNLELDLGCSINYMSMLDAMILKRFYLERTAEPSNVLNPDLKGLFLSLYTEYEECKDKEDVHISKIPLISLMILSNLRFNTLLGRRNRNIITIYENACNNEIFLFDIKEIRSPFMLPLILQNNEKRDNLKNLLLKNNIYPPLHWKIQGLIPEKFGYEHQLSSKILSIPIDQRYSTEDMVSIANVINEARV